MAVNFSNKYPYTDMHEMILDWIIKEVEYWSTKIGKTIQSIDLTGSSGLVDTYTITYSDETTQEFFVTNGNGIVSVVKTGTVGLVDTYTITFQDGSTTTFEVKNGTAAVVQKAGTSISDVMSQKAVTDEIDIKSQNVAEIANLIMSGDDNAYKVNTTTVNFDEDNPNQLLTLPDGLPEAYIGDCNVTKTAVTPGDIYLIKASTFYGNLYYSIFDADDVLITMNQAPDTGAITSTLETIIVIPPTASYIYLSYMNDSVGFIRTLTSIEAGMKQWKGIKWTAIGDSLTEVNLRTTKNYIDYIVEKTGITCLNLGHSGSGYARSYDTNESFYNFVDNVPTDSDVVTIFGSGNDLGAGKPLGYATDHISNDTLCGFINDTIDKLKNRFYNDGKALNIGIITPTPWIGEGTSTAPNSMSAYSDAIEEICKLKGIPCLNLYYCSNLDPDNATFRTIAYSHDEGNGVHPDETGHKLIAPRFEMLLKNLLLNL